MASLVNYQFGKMALANDFAAECESPLSNLAKVNSSTMTTDEKIRSLRFFADTGANDAFPLLEQVTNADLTKNENVSLAGTGRVAYGVPIFHSPLDAVASGGAIELSEESSSNGNHLLS
jgi:hypothetical protein